MSQVDTTQSRRKACVRCAKAKAKCSFTDAEIGCNRCWRLKRECVPEAAPRRRKERQSTRVEALEGKVDAILSLLGTTPAPVVVTRTPAPTEHDRSPTSLGTESNASSIAIIEDRRFDLIENGIITMSTAEILLAKYKRVFSKAFPFVIVAPETTAPRLRAESPFLFLAIMTRCVEDHMLQRRLGVELKKVLCDRVVVNNERDLDLLQGLLVHLAWSHLHFNPRKKQQHMLLGLAVSLVIDMDLDRCPAHRDQRVASNICLPIINANNPAQSKLPIQCRRPRIEIRTLLGCFYLSSS